MKQLIFVVAMSLAVATSLVVLFRAVDSMPTVYQSWDTKECIRVEGRGTCDELPARYHHQWVY